MSTCLTRCNRALPAIFFGIALAIALNVQMMSSPLAGAWLLFFAADCLMMIYQSQDKDRGLIWKTSLLWMISLGVSTFLLAPVISGAMVMWILIAMPMLALAMREEYLRGHLEAALIVVTCYAIGLIVQTLLHVQYTNINYPAKILSFPAVAWPLLDPNNAAAIVNMGMMPCFYMALRKRKWWALVAIFAFAMFATGSKTGALMMALGLAAILTARYRLEITTVLIIVTSGVLAMMELAGHNVVNEAFHYRAMMWSDSMPLAFIRPVSGLGLGTFADYYARVRTETNTAGFFAHNDLLQIAIENGIPAAGIFISVALAVALTTRRANIASAAAMGAVFFHSMMEFQFYLPAVTLLMGLALAYHRCNDIKRAIYS